MQQLLEIYSLWIKIILDESFIEELKGWFAVKYGRVEATKEENKAASKES